MNVLYVYSRSSKVGPCLLSGKQTQVIIYRLFRLLELFFQRTTPPVIFAIGAWELFFKTMFLSKLVDAHFYRIGWEVWRSSLFSSELGFSEGRGKEGMLVIRIIYSRIRRKESCTNSRGGNADSIIFNYYSMMHVLAHPPFQMVTLQEKTHG